MIDKAELKRRVKEISAKQHQSRVMLERLQKELYQRSYARQVALSRFERKTGAHLSLVLGLLQKINDDLSKANVVYPFTHQLRQYLREGYAEFFLEHVDEYRQLLQTVK